MRRWLLLVALLALPAIGLSAAVPKIYWEHDGINTTSYKCVVDGGAAITLSPTHSGTTYSVDISDCTGIMVAGTHTLVIQACNAVGCTSATEITVVKL